MEFDLLILPVLIPTGRNNNSTDNLDKSLGVRSRRLCPWCVLLVLVRRRCIWISDELIHLVSSFFCERTFRIVAPHALFNLLQHEVHLRVAIPNLLTGDSALRKLWADCVEKLPWVRIVADDQGFPHVALNADTFGAVSVCSCCLCRTVRFRWRWRLG